MEIPSFGVDHAEAIAETMILGVLAELSHVVVFNISRVQPGRVGQVGDHLRSVIEQIGPDLAAGTEETSEVLSIVRTDVLFKFPVLNELYLRFHERLLGMG